MNSPGCGHLLLLTLNGPSNNGERDGLYMFEHCSLCFRVRMTAALKGLHLQETVVLDDNSDTMIGLVSKQVIPILVRDCGRPMLESMDMVSTLMALATLF